MTTALYLKRVIQERDYVMRVVKQLAEIIARLLKLALTDPQKARAELDAAGREALQMELGPLALVDAATCAQLLGRADKVVLYATIVEAKAELDLLEGAQHRGRANLVHALELAHEALRLGAKNVEAQALLERLRVRIAGLDAA